MQYAFDRATVLATDDNVTFAGMIQDGWDINGNANGGYLLALIGRAMRDAAGRPDPLTISAHFLAPGLAGPITVDTEVVKRGRLLTTMTASMRGTEREVIRAMGSFGDVVAMSGGFEHVVGSAPELPPYDECVQRGVHNPDTAEVSLPLMNNLRVAIRPEDAYFLTGAKSGRAWVEGWLSFADDRPIDTLALLLAVDGFPPPVFNVDVPPGWVPTVELTAHVRGIPEPGPLRCRFHTDFIQNGFLQEDGEIWDSAGRLVAQSRQLAMLPRAPAESRFG